MMKIILSLFVVKLSILLFLLNEPALCCTSYAIYSGNDTLYAMNFDYPQREIKFIILHENDSTKILKTAFIENGDLCFFNGFNNSGIMSTFQMLFPNGTSPPPQTNQISLDEAFMYSLHYFSGIDIFEEYLNVTGTTVYQAFGSFHCFMADPFGNSIVLETGEEQNEITHSDVNFQVMTNFPIHQYAGLPYTEVSGVGANRYIATYEYLLDNYSNFNYDNSWEGLSESVQSTGSYKTQCSMVFNPKTLEVFVAFNRDFQHVWKISLNDETIETYAGFSVSQTLDFDEDGISENELFPMVNVEESFVAYEIKTNVYPNPYSLSKSNTDILFEIVGDVVDLIGLNLKVYSISGKLEKSLNIDKAININSNHCQYSWDGKNENNESIAPGLHFYVLCTNNKILARNKIIVIR